jgi:broad specificity phosphatase PhoE
MDERQAVLLARHGETDHNVPPQRVQGWIDIPLNARGREQASELAERLSQSVSSLYASHLARARETAEIVGDALLPDGKDAG